MIIIKQQQKDKPRMEMLGKNFNLSTREIIVYEEEVSI